MGGKKLSTVYDALSQLDFRQRAISLDFSLPFDHVRPCLALGILAALGMDAETLRILRNCLAQSTSLLSS